jgi:hypothetical protein
MQSFCDFVQTKGSVPANFQPEGLIFEQIAGVGFGNRSAE